MWNIILYPKNQNFFYTTAKNILTRSLKINPQLNCSFISKPIKSEFSF